MSIEKRKLASGGASYRVRWRENGSNRARNFDRKRDAERFDAETRRLRQTGELGTLTAGKTSLAEFGVEWARKYATRHLEQRTIDSYAGTWDKHILPRLGGYSLAELCASPEIIEEFDAALANDGIGTAARRRALVILQGVMQRAVEWKRITSNPVKLVRKPRAARNKPHTIVQVEQVEAMRAYLLNADRAADAVLVCILAYAGLRPSEALALSLDRIGQRTIRVDRAIDDHGNYKETKNRRTRNVKILGPLANDLATLKRTRNAAGADHSDPLFPNCNAHLWTREDYTNWRNRTFSRAAQAAGAPTATPYALRHTFVSMLIHEGRSPVEVANQAGHAPTMTLDTYAHVYDELDPTARVPAEQKILRARGELVPPEYPSTPTQPYLTLITNNETPAPTNNSPDHPEPATASLTVMSRSAAHRLRTPARLQSSSARMRRQHLRCGVCRSGISSTASGAIPARSTSLTH